MILCAALSHSVRWQHHPVILPCAPELSSLAIGGCTPIAFNQNTPKGAIETPSSAAITDNDRKLNQRLPSSGEVRCPRRSCQRLDPDPLACDFDPNVQRARWKRTTLFGSGKSCHHQEGLWRAKTSSGTQSLPASFTTRASQTVPRPGIALPPDPVFSDLRRLT